jgi:hypothetical protein
MPDPLAPDFTLTTYRAGAVVEEVPQLALPTALNEASGAISEGAEEVVVHLTGNPRISFKSRGVTSWGDISLIIRTYEKTDRMQRSDQR